MSVDPVAEAVEAYEAAVGRVRIVREAWEREGQPLLGTGSTGQSAPHPLWKMLAEAEAHADKLRSRVMPHARPKGGRPKASSSAPDRRPGLRAA